MLISNNLLLTVLLLTLVSSFHCKYPYNRQASIQTHSSSSATKRFSCPTSHLQEEVVQFLSKHEISVKEVDYQNVQILALGSKNDDDKFKLGLHLIPFPNSMDVDKFMNPNTCKDLTDSVKHSPFETIIHLHEDVWRNKHEITKSRILAKMNIVKNRWYARNTFVERISVIDAMEFLENHHLWQSTRAKYNYGLFSKKEISGKKNVLLAVATFSPRRHVRRLECDNTRMFRSHEMIRYCAKRDEVVVGGITKLLARFCQELAPDDIVTCIDRDFGDGDGWLGIGFEKVQVMPPLLMVVEKSNQPENKLQRRYLVGAGVGSANENESKKNTRPGIDLETFSSLSKATNADDGEKILLEHGYCPVFDAGVERRMLLVQKSKISTHTKMKQKELGLDDIIIPEKCSVLDVWQTSKPSFPNKYYSQNEGIEYLLQKAATS